MSAPTERAAWRFVEHGVPRSVALEASRDALSAALDRDEIEAVLSDHDGAVRKMRDVICSGCRLVIGRPFGAAGFAPMAKLVALHQADMIRAHLMTTTSQETTR